MFSKEGGKEENQSDVYKMLFIIQRRCSYCRLGSPTRFLGLDSWHVKKNNDHPGVQIDLIIDRADNVINVCEIKYAPVGYRLTDSELNKIHNRLNIFNLYIPHNKVAQPLLITSNGVIKNNNIFEIPLQVTGDQLFQP